MRIKKQNPDLLGWMMFGCMLLTTLSVIAKDLYDEATRPVVYLAEASEEEEVPQKEVKIRTEVNWTPERIKEEVWTAAARYNTFPEKMWNVILCENKDLDIDLQSYHLYSFSDPSRGIYMGEREKSFGLAQIHLPDHDVSYEEATDPEFALDFMAKHFAEGKAAWWTCYRMIYR